jgi:hypothetical protein
MLKANWPMQIVHRVRREPSVSRTHTHIAGVFTDSGAYVSRADLVASIDRGEIWSTEADGRRARIRTVAHCHVPGCSLTPYVTTAPDHATADSLERLPDC